MRQYLAFFTVAVITATLGLPLSAGKAKAWEYVSSQDVFDETGVTAVVKSIDDGSDHAYLLVSENSDDGWKSIFYTIKISLPGEPCPPQGVPFVKVRIDGWRKDIPAKSNFPAGNPCVVSLLPENWDSMVNLMRNFDHGNMMHTKWLDGRGGPILLEFDISGKTGVFPEAVTNDNAH